MKDQPWDLNQTWPVGRKWCRFRNAPQNFGGPPPKFGVQKTSNFGPLFLRVPHSTPHISGTKKAWTNKNTGVNLQCVPYKITYFPWPLTRKRLRSVCVSVCVYVCACVCVRVCVCVCLCVLSVVINSRRGRCYSYTGWLRQMPVGLMWWRLWLMWYRPMIHWARQLSLCFLTSVRCLQRWTQLSLCPSVPCSHVHLPLQPFLGFR